MEQDSRIEALQKIKEATPQTFSVNDLISLDEDNEDHMIYERRCYESKRRMGKEYR